MYSGEEGRSRRVPRAFLGTAGPACSLGAELVSWEGLDNQRDAARVARKGFLIQTRIRVRPGQKGLQTAEFTVLEALLLPELFIL